MHHSDEPIKGLEMDAIEAGAVTDAEDHLDKMAALLKKEFLGKVGETPGPTGRFPMGKLNEDDKGELYIGIAHTSGKIILSFGTPVEWIAFRPQDARVVAAALINRADEVDKED